MGKSMARVREGGDVSRLSRHLKSLHMPAEGKQRAGDTYE